MIRSQKLALNTNIGMIKGASACHGTQRWLLVSRSSLQRHFTGDHTTKNGIAHRYLNSKMGLACHCIETWVLVSRSSLKRLLHMIRSQKLLSETNIPHDQALQQVNVLCQNTHEQNSRFNIFNSSQLRVLEKSAKSKREKHEAGDLLNRLPPTCLSQLLRQ